MRLTIPTSRGMAPARAAKHLDDDQATLAKDCVLGSGELRPLRGNAQVWTPTRHGRIESIYRFAKQFWFHWTGDVDVVRTLVPGDTTETTFWTGDGPPKATQAGMATSGGGTNYPTNSYALGIEPPGSAPSVSAPTPSTGEAEEPGEDEEPGEGEESGWAWDTVKIGEPGGAGVPEPEIETRYYVYTFVNSWGWESAPSPVSSIVRCEVGATVEVSGMSTPPSGNHAIISKRIYRISTGVDASEFLYVAEVPAASATFSDNVPGSALGEVLPTEGWAPPPDGLKGLLALPNGVLCGFKGKDVYFTPPYAPYAWPVEYMVSTPHPIVALGAFGTNVVVLTEGDPYVATGIDPSAVSLAKLELAQSCVSKRGVASFGADGVVYPSPDGLVVVGPQGPRMLTDGLMTKREWQEYNPSSFTAAVHDGAYIAFYEKTNGDKGGLWFHPKAGFTELGFHATAAWTDLLDDTLYLVVSGQIVAFDTKGEPDVPYTWRSKIFQSPVISPSCARLVASRYGNTELSIEADGQVLYTVTPGSPNAFRLPPALGGCREWQVTVTGTDPVQAVEVATSMQELKR